MSEALTPLSAAVVAALTDDAVLTTFLGGTAEVFNGGVPQGYTVGAPNTAAGSPPDDYVVIGSKEANDAAHFGSADEANGVWVHLWSRTARADGTQLLGDTRVVAMAALVSRALRGRRLVLAGFDASGAGVTDGEAVVGFPTLLRTMPDPDGPFWHGVMRVPVLSLRGAA